MATNNGDNDKRSAAIESFLLKEAVQAGVVKEYKIRHFKNPNRWDK